MITLKNGRDELFQWDIGQRILLTDETLPHEVHFRNTNSTKALVVLMQGNEAPIPNILLQEPYPIEVLLYYEDLDESYTIKRKTFTVIPRPQPEDYIYTETEVLNYETVLNMLADIRDGTESAISAAVAPVTSQLAAMEDYLAAIQDPPYKVGAELNVLDHGAKGDGIADDTLAIQECLNAADEFATIVFPPGKYLVSGVTLQGKNEVSIYGNGAVLWHKADAVTPLFHFIDCPRADIHDLSFDTLKGDTDSPQDFLHLTHTYFATIQGCRFWNASRDAICADTRMEGSEFMGGDELHITGCFIQSSRRYGILLDSISDVTIDGSNIEFGKSDGVRVLQTSGVPSGNINIINNHVLSNDGAGIHMDDGTSRIIVKGNQIRNNGTNGIRFAGGKQYNISDNVIHVNGRTAPYSAAVMIAYAHKGSIVGNMISCTDFPITQGYAIEINNGTDAVVMGNVMYDNSWPGVNVVDSSGVRLLANVGADDVPAVAP